MYQMRILRKVRIYAINCISISYSTINSNYVGSQFQLGFLVVATTSAHVIIVKAKSSIQCKTYARFLHIFAKVDEFLVSQLCKIEVREIHGSLNKISLMLRVISSKLDKSNASGQEKTIQIKTNFILSAADVLSSSIRIYLSFPL